MGMVHGPNLLAASCMVYGINRGYHGDCVLADVLRGGGFATLVYSYTKEGYSSSIFLKKARIAINPIGRVSNLRKRSATKNSALIM